MLIYNAFQKLPSIDAAVPSETGVSSATGRTLTKQVHNHVGGEAGCSRDPVQQQ